MPVGSATAKRGEKGTGEEQVTARAAAWRTVLADALVCRLAVGPTHPQMLRAA